MKPTFITLAGLCLIGACALALVACGNKGPLTLPTNASQAAAKKPAPAAPASKPDDHNSPATSQPQ